MHVFLNNWSAFDVFIGCYCCFLGSLWNCWVFYCWFYCVKKAGCKLTSQQGSEYCVSWKVTAALELFSKDSFAFIHMPYKHVTHSSSQKRTDKTVTISVLYIFFKKKNHWNFFVYLLPIFLPWVISLYTIPPLSHAWFAHAFIVIKIDLSLCLPSCRFPPRLTLWVRANIFV